LIVKCKSWRNLRSLRDLPRRDRKDGWGNCSGWYKPNRGPGKIRWVFRTISNSSVSMSWRFPLLNTEDVCGRRPRFWKSRRDLPNRNHLPKGVVRIEVMRYQSRYRNLGYPQDGPEAGRRGDGRRHGRRSSVLAQHRQLEMGTASPVFLYIIAADQGISTAYHCGRAAVF